MPRLLWMMTAMTGRKLFNDVLLC